METSGEPKKLVAKAKDAKKRRKRKPKPIGSLPKRWHQMQKNKKQRRKESKNDNPEDGTPTEEQQPSVNVVQAPPIDEPPKTINELITEDERKEIESYYYLDLTFVDKRKVKKSIFCGDKIYRCRLCQTAYARLDKCQVGCIHTHTHTLLLLLFRCFLVRFALPNTQSSASRAPFVGIIFGIACSRSTFGVTTTCCRTFVTAVTLRR